MMGTTLVSFDGEPLPPSRKYKMRNLYRDEFRDEDFQLPGACVNKTIVIAPIIPEDVKDHSIIYPDLNPEEQKMQALVFRVVAYSAEAKKKLPGLARGKILIVQNMAGDSNSPRAKYICIEPQDVRCIFNDEDLA